MKIVNENDLLLKTPGTIYAHPAEHCYDVPSTFNVVTNQRFERLIDVPLFKDVSGRDAFVLERDDICALIAKLQATLVMMDKQ
ncbi:hypothetical protein [Paraburkholderia sp. BCC1886]|uniref:hypothetical protein n=1 Tax=Paraburkholderia sp. BCC1886 TaxID=2562670 RepID=UPI001182700E|nr:hypothetical protein [Paraburkholderia sp. BCC1886]